MPARSRCRRNSCNWSAVAIPRCGRRSNDRSGFLLTE
jgi:hypothetical protein